MTTFENELRKVFDNIEELKDKKYVGRVFYASVDNNVKFRAEYISTNSYQHYDALRIKLLHRNEGELDANTLHLKEVWGNFPVPGNPNFRDGVSPHMWIDRGELKWYAAAPSVQDFQSLAKQISDYIEVFRDMSLEREHLPGLDAQIAKCESQKEPVEADAITKAMERGEFR